MTTSIPRLHARLPIARLYADWGVTDFGYAQVAHAAIANALVSRNIADLAEPSRFHISITTPAPRRAAHDACHRAR